MIKKLLGIAPHKENDGSYTPSKVALKLAVPDKTDYQPIKYDAYKGDKSKIVVVFTEQKNMTMKNGKQFSTGNHPVESLVPMLHLKQAGFDFHIVTSTGKPVVFEMWAMPKKDEHVLGLYQELKSQFEKPDSLSNFVDNNLSNPSPYAAVFIPGGHGAMLGLPDDLNMGVLLHWAHQYELYTITICHGPGVLLSTKLSGQNFLYDGYEMAVFPDSVDKQTPIIGYLPGHMPWKLNQELEKLGVTIINKKADDVTHIDRKLISGASPLASNKLGKLAAETLLNSLK